MIIFSMPIFGDEDKMHGFLVLSYNAEPLVDAIQDHESISLGRIFLLDKDANWLLSEQYSGVPFEQAYPNIWEDMYLKDQGELKSPDGLFYYTTLRPAPTLASEAAETIDLTLSSELKYMPSGYEWKLITYLSQDFLVSRYTKVTTFTYTIFVMVNIAFLLASITISAILLRARYRDNLHKIAQENYVNELKDKRAELQQMVGGDSNELVHILCHDLVNPPLACIDAVIQYTQSEDTEDLELTEIVRESLDEALAIINTVRTIRALDSGGKKNSLSFHLLISGQQWKNLSAC